MKFLSAVIAVLVGAASAQEEKPKYVDSAMQTLPLVDKDSVEHGNMTWFTRTYHELDGKANVTQMHVQCRPQYANNTPFNQGMYNKKEITCQIGVHGN